MSYDKGEIMRAAHIVLGASVVALAGCANLNTVDRQTSLSGEGKAVHLDAPQRLAISNKDGWVCAEPSPDALQAYASSLGLGFAAPSKESVSVAQALSASAGSIGLRTQSITLMRDALYRICELYFNKAIDKHAAVQLLERSQDLSLGVLAIEQLTGAVVAQQVSINTSSAAATAAAINDTQKELDRAKADEGAKKKAVDSAQTALDSQKKAVTEKTTAANTAKEKSKSTQAAIDALAPTLVDAQKALEEAINDRVAFNLKLAALNTKIVNVDGRAKTLKKQVDDRHEKALTAEKAYQDALVAIPKVQKTIDELDAARKLAADAEKNAKASLAQAENDLSKAKQDLDDAKVAGKGTDAAVDQAQDAVDQLGAQIKAAREDPNQITTDKAVADLKAAADDQKKKQDALDSAKVAWEEAQTNTREIEKLGNSASTAASAATSGAGGFSTATNRYGVSKDTVEGLARATTEIVRLVLDKGHLTDSCGVMLMSYTSNPNGMGPAFDQILSICKEVIAATLMRYRSSGNSAGGAASPAADFRPNAPGRP